MISFKSIFSRIIFLHVIALVITAIVFWFTTKDDPKLAARRRSGAKPEPMSALLAPLKNLQVWRFALYYFFVFGGYVALSVADKGLGIPAEEREAIFGRFIRGAEAGRLGIKGTGLGLALVTHIVAAHHGRLELESTVGEGSRFTILLPAAVRSVEAGSSDPAGE